MKTTSGQDAKLTIIELPNYTFISGKYTFPFFPPVNMSFCPFQ